MTLKVAVISECLYCNTPIKRGKYCSKKCFGKAHTTSELRKCQTCIEKKMKEALRRNGLKFEEQYNLDNKFLIDIAIPELKIAIECDGEYWHSLPRNQHVDKQKQIHCDKYGWQLLRFTDKEINTKLDDCINIIFNMIKGVMQRVE